MKIIDPDRPSISGVIYGDAHNKDVIVKALNSKTAYLNFFRISREIAKYRLELNHDITVMKYLD